MNIITILDSIVILLLCFLLLSGKMSSKTTVHVYAKPDQFVTESLHLIINKLKEMNEQLAQIKADLEAAKASLEKIDADVTTLNDKIGAITGGLPTSEEWEEVKTLAAELKTKTAAVDARTDDAQAEDEGGESGEGS